MKILIEIENAGVGECVTRNARDLRQQGHERSLLTVRMTRMTEMQTQTPGRSCVLGLSSSDAFASPFAYVPASAGGIVTVIDTATDSVVDTIPVIGAFLQARS